MIGMLRFARIMQNAAASEDDAMSLKPVNLTFLLNVKHCIANVIHGGIIILRGGDIYVGYAG